MRRIEGENVLGADEVILNILERRTVRNASQLAQDVGKIAQEKGITPWCENTIRDHLKDLIKAGKVGHQDQGYFINRGWKEGQPKAFILVEVAKPRQRGDNFQKKLLDEIRDGFRRGEHEGLNLISIDAVMGADFSVIVQVYSDDLHFIGRFVKEYLLTSELVTNTRTIMVWPTESSSSRNA